MKKWIPSYFRGGGDGFSDSRGVWGYLLGVQSRSPRLDCWGRIVSEENGVWWRLVYRLRCGSTAYATYSLALVRRGFVESSQTCFGKELLSTSVFLPRNRSTILSFRIETNGEENAEGNSQSLNQIDCHNGALLCSKLNDR